MMDSHRRAILRHVLGKVQSIAGTGWWFLVILFAYHEYSMFDITHCHTAAKPDIQIVFL